MGLRDKKSVSSSIAFRYFLLHQLMEKEGFFPVKTFYFSVLSRIVENRVMYRRLGKKIIVSVKSSILRDFWDTDMSRNLYDMHEMYWVFIFDQR